MKLSVFFVFYFVIHFAKAEKSILVLGGNGFMGSDTVDLLLRYGYNIIIVNRGNWYWDSKDRIFPKVKSINCDRQNGLKSCNEFMELLRNEETRFDAVIDFSAYYENQVKESASVLQGKADLYIFISTDSVYDVCKEKLSEAPYKETDAVRPEDEADRKQFEAYSYGHRKLTAEEELVHQRENDGIPYIILRLPDVIGPRDGTHRWWMYQLWLKVSSELKERPVTIPDFLVGYGVSLVYSPDVAQVIFGIIHKEDVRDEAFNLAWPEAMTLKDILEDINAELDLDSDVNIKVLSGSEPKSNIFLYPSGRRGPIDVNKAIEVLQWQPTPWKDVVKETVSFYEDAANNSIHMAQMDEVIQLVENYLTKEDENKTVFYKALEKLYNIDLKHFILNHDEL